VYKHILIPTDGSPLSAEAIRHGVALAKESDATVSFLTVSEPFHIFSLEVDQVDDTPAEYRRHAEGRARRALEEASQVAQAAGVPRRNDPCGGRPALPCDHNDGRREGLRPRRHGVARTAGLSAVVLGSETLKVLTHSDIPVLVYRSAFPTHRGARRRQTERMATERA
jgi:nucleotide-binding universal stress UspA family protein